MGNKRMARVFKDCVACGNCTRHCPHGAIAIEKGLWAKVEEDKCKGCGRCAIACPACVIHMIRKEVQSL